MNQMLTTAYRLIGPALVFAVFLVSQGCGPETPSGPSKKGFEFTFSGTSNAATVASGAPANFRITVNNHGPSADSLRMLIRKEKPFPDLNWSASYCVGQNCIPLFSDSASYTAMFAAGASDIVEVDFNAGDSGSAELYVRLWNGSDTTQRFERTFTCTVQ